MDMAFVKALNMSISASWLVLAVIALRVLLKKSPRWIHVALWALVALRLICPVSIESPVSLVPSTQTVPEEIFYMEPVQHRQNVTLEILQPRPNLEGVAVETEQTVNVFQTWELKWSLLWPCGAALLLGWALFSYFRLKKKVDASLDLGNGVFLCDYIDTPFILGIITPKIYLPSAMEPGSAAHVLAHERAHIARKDHWWKPFGYLLLGIYWFNPVLWLAYVLLCRDIELACDEKVIRDMALPQKKAYSEALLSCSVSRRYIAACPLAFGEVGVKERVKTVLNYKKPAFRIVLAAILALIVTAICFLTDPVKKEDVTYRVEEVVYRNPVLSYYMTAEEAPLFQIAQDYTLRVREDGGEWEELGEFSEIKLSELNFDALFWGFEQGKPWEEAAEAWLLALPPEETANSTRFYLLLRQEGGLYLGEGAAFTNVYPLHKHVLDAGMSVNWLYRLVEYGVNETVAFSSPYPWTSTVQMQDVSLAYASDGDTGSVRFEGSRLEELVSLLNGVKEYEILTRKPTGADDPLWNYDGTVVTLYCKDSMPVYFRYVDDTVIIGTDSSSDTWKTDGYWIIRNEALTAWMARAANGGTWMLTQENREEIRRLLRIDQVKLFDPRESDDFLFVGCSWNAGEDIGVAVFESVEDGYKLLKLIRGEEVKPCASGSELYYCDYQDMRIFLVMNRSITGMELAGACEAAYAVESHPGLVAVYFPENQNLLYRFRYGDAATTMYMDRSDQIHGEVP